MVKYCFINSLGIHFEHKLEFNSSWPSEKLAVGQIGGVATDKDGNVYIFHRGSRQWNAQCHIYCATFCVFKIPQGETSPSLVLGHRFQHGSDLTSFCKPTDVAVLSSGEFFVSDGYCNGRVLKFARNGTLIRAWGERQDFAANPPPIGSFDISHSVTVSEENNLVCVADRENGRIQCFDLDGNFKHIIKHPEFGNRLFAIEQSPVQGGVLYAVNGPSFSGPTDISVQGFTLDIKTGALLETWNIPQHLHNPHDVCIHTGSQSVYVGELNPQAVWKLSRQLPTAESTTPVHCLIIYGEVSF
ncbi:unnamed protein product [Candidula unifasciata]|uniref:Peptidylamidoglycolate lyase n=1 Tax=Candidula unifasciata TaxID=100452 RepID=A0A8S3ZS83_9EUPU|nr:unnamed protein product [Candidula unifasciata]